MAFAYTGGSSQWVGMGKALYEREPVARAVLDRCDAVFREERGGSLLDVMFGQSDAGDLDDADWMQPAIYALGCALTALWESVGVRPAVVVGHSLGEIAAAQTAGVYSLEDGMRFTARRSLLMAALPEKGAMAAVFAPADRVAAMVEEQNAASPGLGVNIAADNGAQQVISGPEKDVQALVERFGSEGLWARQLRKSIAYHSVLVEPALDDLEAIFTDLDVAPPSISLISSTTGRLVEPTERPDGAYWRRHAREPVAFRECINTLAEEGVDVVVELGAQAVLGMMVAMNWPGAKEPAIRSRASSVPPRLRRRATAASWRRWRERTRRGSRSRSRGCTRGRSGGASRCRPTRSSDSGTGWRRRGGDGSPPGIRCWGSATSRRGARCSSSGRWRRTTRPGWTTTACSGG